MKELMGKHDFTPLKNLLPKVVNHYNLARQVDGSLICHHFRTFSKTLWNDSIEDSVRPQSFAQGILKVAVAHSGWAQQVQFKKAVILAYFKTVCPTIYVRDVRPHIISELFHS